MRVNTIKNVALSGLIGLGSITALSGCNQINNRANELFTKYTEKSFSGDYYDRTMNDSVSKIDAIKINLKDTLKNFYDAKKYLEGKLREIAVQRNQDNYVDHPVEASQLYILKDFLIKQKFKGKNELLRYLNAIIEDYNSGGCHSTSYRFDSHEEDNYLGYKLQMKGYDIEDASSIRGTKLRNKDW